MTAEWHNKWSNLAVAAGAVVLPLTTWFSAAAVVPELTRDWNLDLGQAGLLTTAVQLGFVIGALASSFLSLADIVPLLRLMAVAAVIAAIANAVLLLEPGLAPAVAARFATGAALAGIYPPAMKFIATWFQTGRGLAMGVMVGALTLGSALPHLIRAGGAALPWEIVVVATSLASLVAAAIFLMFLREGPYAFSRARVDPRQIGAILRNRPVMLANLGYFGHMWELYAMWGWILAYATAATVQQSHAFNASLLAFGVVAVGAPGCVLAGLMADRIGRCATTALMMAVSGLCAILIGLTFNGPTWIFVVVVLLWGATVVSDSAQFSACVSELSDPSQVGASLAFQMGVGFAITIFTLWLVPTVAELMGGWQWTFLILAPGPIVGIWAMLNLRRHPDSVLLANGRR